MLGHAATWRNNQPAGEDAAAEDAVERREVGEGRRCTSPTQADHGYRFRNQQTGSLHQAETKLRSCSRIWCEGLITYVCASACCPFGRSYFDFLVLLSCRQWSGTHRSVLASCSLSDARCHMQQHNVRSCIKKVSARVERGSGVRLSVEAPDKGSSTKF